MPFNKKDDVERLCFGYASTEAVDSEGEIVSREALVGALPDYMKFANIREMHQLSAVGVTLEANIDEKGLYLGAKIVDDMAWLKVTEGVYKGFSIGGRATARDPKNRKIITGLELIEISVVDRPANPEALIEIWKAANAEHSEGSMPPVYQPAQYWDCGLAGHRHATKDQSVKCSKEQEKRFETPGTMTSAHALVLALADKISGLDPEGLAKASAALEKAEQMDLQEQAEQREAEEGSVEKLADRLRDIQVPKGATHEMIGNTLGCSPEMAKSAVEFNIIRDNPAMAKSLGLLRADGTVAEPGSVVPPAASVDALTEANRIIARAAAMDDGKKPTDKKPPPKKPDDGDEDDKAAEGDEGKEAAKKPGDYGNVSYADPGYQKDGKPRYPIDTEKHIRAAWSYINQEANCTKYTADQCSTIKRRVVSAWKKEIDKDGPPSANGKKEKAAMISKFAKLGLGNSDASQGLKKGIETVISALSLLKQVNQIQNCLVKEQAKEDDKSDQPGRWAELLKMMGGMIEDLATEEIGELLATGVDVDMRWGYNGYDVAWAAKALAPARLSFAKQDFINEFVKRLGDDTAAEGFLSLTEFTDALKAGGSLSIEEWGNSGEGTGYGSHSDASNDSWGARGMTKSAQSIHDLSCEMGAKCKAANIGDTEKEHNDEPSTDGSANPKPPPKDIKEGTAPPRKDPKKPAPTDDDEDDTGDGKPTGKAALLTDVLLSRMLDQNDRLMNALIDGRGNDAAPPVRRDPPKPKGTFKTVGKEDDYEPAPGSDGTGGSTGGQPVATKKAEDYTQEERNAVLKGVLNQPHFVAR